MDLREQIAGWVSNAINSAPVYDLHTHLYPANFRPLMLWGIDELLTYHYLIGESIRASRIDYDKFWAMPTAKHADFIWKTLFVERPPLSEACRGVITVLHRLGLDTSAKNLTAFRDYFRSTTAPAYLDRVLKLANVSAVTMTNDPFDPLERHLAQAPRARPALRRSTAHRSAAAWLAERG